MIDITRLPSEPFTVPTSYPELVEMLDVIERYELPRLARMKEEQVLRVARETLARPDKRASMVVLALVGSRLSHGCRKYLEDAIAELDLELSRFAAVVLHQAVLRARALGQSQATRASLSNAA